jgi:mono/diheme cytochrome c family protein
MGKTQLFWAHTIFLLTAFCSNALAADADSGKQMYRQYCASCHGETGQGNGTVAAQLKIKPADLTLIRKKNKGIYPLDNVMATIDGRRIVKAHGDREMPVWGEVFTKERQTERYSELTTLLKAKIIAEYVATLQR